MMTELDQRTNDNKQFWEAHAEDYATNYIGATDWVLGYSMVERMLGDVGGKRILDYGCGSGKFSRRLRDLGAQVIGVDPSSRAIELAKQIDSRRIDYIVLNQGHPPFKQDSPSSRNLTNNSVDAAVANFVLCTISSHEAMADALQMIRDNLREKGKLVILEPHPDALEKKYRETWREEPRLKITGAKVHTTLQGMSEPVIDTYRTKKDYLQILKSTGFSHFKIEEPLIHVPMSYLLKCLFLSLETPTMVQCGIPAKHKPDPSYWQAERIYPPFLIIEATKR
jgi:SAM-dependent methyltransferase